MRTTSVPRLGALLAFITAALLGNVGARTVAAHHAPAQNAAQEKFDQLPHRFKAFAQNLNPGQPKTQVVDIKIRHWTSDAEHDRLLALLRDKGQGAMLAALQHLPAVGTIRAADTLAYDLHYARHRAFGDGGEQVMVVTDRPMSFEEAARSERSTQYPFTVIQLRVNGYGKGRGWIAVAAKFNMAGREVAVEHYDSHPVLLTDVTRED